MIPFGQEECPFHYSNTKVHRCVVNIAKFNELGCELLPHASYSPVSARSGYFPFQIRRIGSAERDLNPTNDLSLKQMLVLCVREGTNCEELKREYVEKKMFFVSHGFIYPTSYVTKYK